jgi:signal transduction histidine kinase
VIEDILDFSKAESGRLSLTCADFDVRTLMRGVAGLYEEAARGKGLAMTVSVDATVPAMMRGDEKRLQQVVRHLLDNAVKFSDEGSIAVTVDIGDGGRGRQRRDRGRAAASPPRVSPGDTELVHIAIADSGIGVPPDSAPWLFQPFRQADGSSTRRYGGAGLGLAICKQLVERMGGAIWFDSEVGHGSVFHVTLPLVRCAAVANQPT